MEAPEEEVVSKVGVEGTTEKRDYRRPPEMGHVRDRNLVDSARGEGKNKR